ncbi:MAG: sodium/proline symporter [Candidatus Aminicenantes bacterium]|nr:sodium/proline symporter [Candidatus Aminicenantes bacterium]
MTQLLLISAIVFYFLILVFIGIFSRKESDSVGGYYAAGKKLRYWIVSFSTNATGESSWLLLGLSGMGYAFGAHALWVMVGEVLGVAFAWIFMARRFKVYTDEYNSITVPDYLEDRFKDGRHTLRIISAVILLPMVTSYVAAQLTASGKAFKSFLHIDYVLGIVIGLVIILFYTVIGGITAVARADFFHGLLMLMGLILLPIVAIVHCGGFGPMVQALRSIDPNLLKLGGPRGFSTAGIVSIIGFLGVGLPFMGSPQLFVRYLAARDQKELIYGKYVAILFILIVDTGAVLTGMAGRALFSSLEDQEYILPTVASNLFPTVFTGLFIAIVLAAIISTVDSLLILLSSSIIRDVYQKIFRPDAPQKSLVLMGKIITIVVGIAAFWFSLSETRLIFWFVLFAWSGIGAAFCPVMVLSLLWKGMTRAGAIAGMCSGFVITMTWAIFFKSATNLYEMVPGFFGAIVVIILVSLFTQPPQGAARDLESVSETVAKYKI